MCDIFKPHGECTQPRTVLIEGNPGMGKTTYCNKLAYDWATNKNELEGCVQKFQVVLLLKCRDIKSDLWEAIDDQLLPLDVQEEEIEGFTEEDARMFITKYFTTMEDLAQKLLNKLKQDKVLRDLTANPLNTALLCLLCDDVKGIFPESRYELFLEIVQCVLRRYRKKKGLPATVADLIEVYKAQLKYLGSIALNGLLEDSMYFQDSQLENSLASDLLGFGFLSVQPGSSKRRPCLCYGFLHKSFQELFAAFYLCCQLLDGEISPDDLVADTRYFHELKQVLLFTCGMLAAHCEETAVALIKSITRQVNKGKSDDFVFVLNCINECKREHGDLQMKLARVFGSVLQLQEVNLRDKGLNAAAAAALAEAVKTNSKLTKLDLSLNKIDDAGVAALAEAISINSTLGELNLSLNQIEDYGAAALAGAIKRNSTFTVLYLSGNKIGDSGGSALAEAIQKNCTLTKLNLSWNGIGDAVGAPLAEAIEANSTIRELNLCGNQIGDASCVAMAEALEANSTLAELDLSWNGISNAGRAALDYAMEINSTITVHTLN